MTPPKRQPKRALTLLARRQARPFRLRLVDAAALAAAGLLLLKLTSLMADAPAEPAVPLPDFARALAKPRTGYELPDPATTGSVTPKEKPPEKPPEPPVYQPAVAEPFSPSERALLEKLSARRDALKQRSETLDMREQMLDAAGKKLDAGIADLKTGEDRADLGGAKKAEAEKTAMKGLVTMYETMKPKDAARVFDRLGLDVLVPIVLAMNPRKMAEVLSAMGSEPAEKLTVALANRARGVEPVTTAQAGAALPAGELPALDPGPPTRSGVP